MSNFLTRTLTGVLFVVVLVGCMVVSPLSFIVLFAAVTGLTIWEFTTLLNRHAGASINGFINTLAAVYLFFAMVGFCAELVPSRAFIPYLLTLIYLMVSELYLRKSSPLKNWGFAFASQLYVALGFSLLGTLAFTYDSFANQVHFDYCLPLSLFIFLWVNDTGAYLCGSLLHKRFPAKLFERISPKKSWVGSIGGVALCLIAGVVLSYAFPGRLNLREWLGFAVVVCLFGTWGDLFESLFKRELGIKDSGNFLPGHGGLLDRFDSALLAIPATVLYIYSIRAF